MKENIAPLYGIVLAGGKSSRMGQDKGLIKYHEKPQREYAYELLKPLCAEVFLGIREEQKAEISTTYATVIDQNEFKGPFNSLLSAHRSYPNAAWLVVACDLPLLDTEALQYLLHHRNAAKMATSFTIDAEGLPEPMLAIWEPKGLANAIRHLETSKSSCPRKYLINSDTELVTTKHKHWLYNANTMEEYTDALSKVK